MSPGAARLEPLGLIPDALQDGAGVLDGIAYGIVFLSSDEGRTDERAGWLGTVLEERLTVEVARLRAHRDRRVAMLQAGAD